MFSIFPRDEKFYTLLTALSAQAECSAGHLGALFKSNDESSNILALEGIRQAKAAAKDISFKITNELCRSFVTPFDREDIQSIADNLYKIPKTIEKIGERVQLHAISGDRSDFAPQVELIGLEAEAMTNLITGLTGKGSNKLVLEKAEKLNQLEQRGDDIRNDLLGRLYTAERDIRDLLIRRDIYDMLERVVDRFRDVASTAIQIVLKHS